MVGVILSAGLGTRLGLHQRNYFPKTLLKVAGRELLLRHLMLLSQYGVKRFVIVVNPKNRNYIEEFLRRHPEFSVEVVENPHPERGNGYSLLCAEEKVGGERFVLVMGDHIYEEAFVKEAVKGRGLLIDEKGLYIDHQEATKVKVEKGRVRKIGKELTDYDGFDTGFFVLEPEVFDKARRLKEKREVSLSEIVSTAELEVHRVSGLFWMDIDTEEELKKATGLLVKSSVKGAGDGFVSRHLNRKISTRISAVLCDHLSPNTATLLSFLLGLVSALVCYLSPLVGGILYQLHSILDGVDGEIARAALKKSRFGGLLDSVLDRYVDFSFLAALLVYIRPEGVELLVALFALLGSLMVSYTTERFKGAYGRDAYESFPSLKLFPGKRDERIFFVFACCVLGVPRLVFPVLALFTNAKVAFTLFVFYKKARQ